MPLTVGLFCHESTLPTVVNAHFFSKVTEEAAGTSNRNPMAPQSKTHMIQVQPLKRSEMQVRLKVYVLVQLCCSNISIT